MRLGKRTRQRGALFKMLRFAESRAARLRAAPPLALPPDPAPALPDLRGLRQVGLTAITTPWARPDGAPAAVAPRDVALWVIVAEGALFGGSYELVARARARSGAPPILVSDVFVDAIQVERAARAGAAGIIPVAGASPRAGVDDAELARWAAEAGLLLVPELAPDAPWPAAPLAAVSRFDRDTSRLRPWPQAPAGTPVLALFAHDAPHGPEAADPLPDSFVPTVLVDPDA